LHEEEHRPQAMCLILNPADGNIVIKLPVCLPVILTTVFKQMLASPAPYYYYAVSKPQNKGYLILQKR